MMSMSQKARVTGRVLQSDGKPAIQKSVILSDQTGKYYKDETGKTIGVKTANDGKFAIWIPYSTENCNRSIEDATIGTRCPYEWLSTRNSIRINSQEDGDKVVRLGQSAQLGDITLGGTQDASTQQEIVVTGECDFKCKWKRYRWKILGGALALICIAVIFTMISKKTNA